MPLVQKLWAPYGLKSWKVAQYDNEGAPYIVQAWLEWESKDHSDRGVASDDGNLSSPTCRSSVTKPPSS
ncbi:hypothetical protein RRF57_002024 [Xylaria bambusicola]|uniref:Uncharacterized protein n=1 Tax=Xylaria bambusicola TaxID=326684 RepID=A0AAN7UI66_9PEZI